MATPTIRSTTLNNPHIDNDTYLKITEMAYSQNTSNVLDTVQSGTLVNLRDILNTC